jgi:hypothetical protein
MNYFDAIIRRSPGLQVFLAIFLLIPAIAFAQVYQWKDADGNVHFGDKPPEDVDAKSMSLPKGPSDEEVEKAQQELQQTLDAREAANKVSPTSPTPSALERSNEPLPEFACYTPIEDVLRGPTQAAYVPINPTDVTDAQRRGARTILASAKGSWRGSSLELVCSGQVNAPRSEHLHFSVSSTATWRGSQGLMILENRARGSQRRSDEVRVSYIEVGDALYYFDAKGGGNRTVDRTIALRGNMAEGLYLDKDSLAFMSKRRSYHVMRTELRHLMVRGGKLEFTELYFHNNLLTGSRVWTLSR